MSYHGRVKWPWLVATLACTVALVVQLGLVLQGYIAPTVTNTVVENKEL
jgi:hypothetical protein